MNYKVLVIDDEPWSRQLVISLIEWDRMNLSLIGEAEDASMGLSLISELKPHIIITDMRMPGMSGSDFLKALENRFPAIKIIVLSGYDDFSYLQQALRSGALDYLLKPVDPGELNKTLENCIGELSDSGASLIFKDSVSLDDYVGYRRKIFANLLELDKSAVSESLGLLQRYLIDSDRITYNKETGSRVLHDFILILEEFTTRFGLDTQSLDSIDLNPGKISEDQVFPTIVKTYEAVIDVIVDFQKKKGFLDLKEVKEHIDRYFHEQLSLETVAKLFLVTKEHMSRSFKKEFDITLNDYITKLRMDKAQALIVDRAVEIKQVAFLCGYSDLTYFYRVFKKYFGIPPGQMRDGPTSI